MSDDAQQPHRLPLGDHRPTRDEAAPPSPEGRTAALSLPPADTEAAPPRAARDPVTRAASVLSACMGHALLLLALVGAPPTEFGDGGHALDAISISIVPASAIDARAPAENIVASAPPAPMAPNSGDESAPSAAAPEKPRPPEPEIDPPAQDIAEPAERAAAPDAPAPIDAPEAASTITSPPKPAEETRIAAAEPVPQPRPPEDTPEEKPDEPKPEESSSASSAAGGATSQGASADQPPKAAAAAASRGEANAYGMAVQAALLAVDQREAKARVSAARAKGTVVVRLVLDEKGALLSSDVVRSSGSHQLDDAALLLVRLASFPPPPPGLTEADRSYVAPIRFR